MNLTEHYNFLYINSIQRIICNDYDIDTIIDSPHDTRRGITLIIRPNKAITNAIQEVLYELQLVEPEQYYHPISDMHITVLSVISCYEGFDLQNICITDYIDIIKKSILTNNTIEIEFRGITVSPSCIMIQGFPSNSTLQNIRDNLRTNFKNSGLQQSIDIRYSIQTAHITVVRFRKLFTKKEDFLKIIEKYKNHYFGKLSAKSMEFVYNDWYQKKEFAQKLQTFDCTFTNQK